MKFIVSEKEEGLSLGQCLRERLNPPPSLRQIKRDLEKGGCLLNGKLERFASKKVRKGDEIEFQALQAKTVLPTFQKEMILFEDQDFCVLNKPAGLVCSQESVKKFLEEKAFLVHRLDKETTGALIIAKNQKTQAYFEKQFREKKVDKTYLALVFSKPKQKEGTVAASLEKGGFFEGQTLWKVGKGRPAVTHWKVLREGREVSLIEAIPITGKTHQIRVHLAHIGCPLVGDLQYGEREKNLGLGKRVQLHALKIAFTLPKTGEKIEIEAPLYPDMEEMIEKL